jgi:hypothetical protein
MLAAALDYAVVHGWCVIALHDISTGHCSCRDGASCKTPGKHPRLKDWRNTASKDAGTIAGWWKQWPQANVGILTGARSGIVVLDVDPRHGGDDDLATLLAEHGPLPETVTVATGGGGAHHYFAHPGGTVEGYNLTPGLELKGDGQFVVAPPSLTGEKP